MRFDICEFNRTRTVHRVDGKTLAEIAKESGVPLGTIQHRYSRGVRDYKDLTRDDNLHNLAFRKDVACDRGRKFLDAAEKRGLSISQIEEQTGIARSAIWNFINNDADISGKRLARLCACVGISMDYVCGIRREK